MVRICGLRFGLLESVNKLRTRSKNNINLQLLPAPQLYFVQLEGLQ